MQMYHEMHKIMYQSARTMAAEVFILQIWAWEHLLVCKSIFHDTRKPLEPYIYRYVGQLTQPALGKIEQWCGQLDDMVVVIWRPWVAIEVWDDAQHELPHMFFSCPLIG